VITNGVKLDLGGVITAAVVIALLCFLIWLNRQFPTAHVLLIGIPIAFILIGSVVKVWRALAHGDFSVTGQFFWLPKRWREWAVPPRSAEKR
jgi:hypothetical protein